MTDAREFALSAHAHYYEHGTYDDDRLKWTVENFVAGLNPRKILEAGCGDGALLRLLSERGIESMGVDASSSGIDRCKELGLTRPMPRRQLGWPAVSDRRIRPGH